MLLLQLRLALGRPVARRTSGRPARTSPGPPTATSTTARTTARPPAPTNDCKVKRDPGVERLRPLGAQDRRRAADQADRDGDGLPEPGREDPQRDERSSGSRIVDAGGYKAPLPDKKGPNDKLDIYLVDIGDDGLYGYCGPEDEVGPAGPTRGYCVLDDDYADRSSRANTPLENLQVTAAHEFFHAVQFAYDVRRGRLAHGEHRRRGSRTRSSTTSTTTAIYLPRSPLRAGEAARPPAAARTSTATGSGGATSPSASPRRAAPGCRCWCATSGSAPTTPTAPPATVLDEGAATRRSPSHGSTSPRRSPTSARPTGARTDVSTRRARPTRRPRWRSNHELTAGPSVGSAPKSPCSRT